MNLYKCGRIVGIWGGGGISIIKAPEGKRRVCLLDWRQFSRCQTGADLGQTGPVHTLQVGAILSKFGPTAPFGRSNRRCG